MSWLDAVIAVGVRHFTGEHDRVTGGESVAVVSHIECHAADVNSEQLSATLMMRFTDVMLASSK